MEHIATNPNRRISQKEALQQLYAHPEFPADGRVVSISRVKGLWEAVIETPDTVKQAAPPAFLDEEGPGTDDDAAPEAPKPDDGPPSDDAPEPDAPSDDEDSDDKPKDEKKSEKVEIADVLNLVKQIAEAVGVKTDALGEDGEAKDALDDLIAPDGPDGPPHPDGPPAPPPPAAKGPHGAPHPMHPGDAPPGTIPVGAPSFASTQEPPHPLVGKAAEFVVRNEAFTGSLKDAEREINDLYNPWGYKVTQMHPAEPDAEGKRLVRAKISKR